MKNTSAVPPSTDDGLFRQAETPQLSASPFAKKIFRYLKAINAIGDDAEDEARIALEDLRKDAEEVIAALAQAEPRCNRSDYPLRWALVYAACQMQHEAALPFLRNLVLTPIPPEQSKLPHSFSTVKEETVLRTTAIEGVGYLAARGNSRALDVLFEALDISSISIRRASIQAILAAEPDLRGRVAERVPSEFHYLLNIRPAYVTDVPQVKNPEKHLRDKRDLQKKPEPPKIPERQSRTTTRKGKTPKTGGK
jgi:hypothetical protein